MSVCICGGDPAQEDECPKHGWIETTKRDYDRLRRIEDVARAITERYAPGEDGWVDRIRAALEEEA